MDPVTIGSLGLLLAGDVYKGVKGAGQIRDAKKYARVKRPNEKIPDAITEALNNARFRAGNIGMPGQARLENKLNQDSANARRGIVDSQSDSGSILAGLTALDANTKDAVANLGVQGAQMKMAAESDYDNQLNNYGQWQNEIWQNNVNKPFLAAMATTSSLNNAGNMNLEGALNGALSKVATFGAMGGFDKTKTDPAAIPAAVPAPGAAPVTNPNGLSAEDIYGAAGPTATTGPRVEPDATVPPSAGQLLNHPIVQDYLQYKKAFGAFLNDDQIAFMLKQKGLWQD